MPYFGVPIRNGLPIGLGTLTALAQAVAVVVPPVSSDPYFEYVSLLANTTSTNGAQNNTFLDASTNAFSITRNGNTTQGTFSPFSQTGWSNYFDGTGDWLSVPDNAAFTLGSGNFTVEAWIYNGVTGSRQVICGQIDSAGTIPSLSVYVEKTAANKLFGGVASGSTSYTATSTADLPLNQWVHVAFVRNGNTGTLYINGSADGTVSLTGVTVNDSTNTFSIGRLGEFNSLFFTGYISNFRQVVGTAVYTANFTPPTSPLTAIANTSLLTCQSNRFIDNSSNAFAITRNGDVSVQAFSPFNPTTAWSASTNGGSGYFDGTGDYLSLADNAAFDFGSGNFTIEAWVNIASASGVKTIVSKIRDFGPFLIVINGTTVSYYLGSTGSSWNIANGVSGGTVSVGAWAHVVLVRNGSTFTPYVNGVAGTTTTFASALAVNTHNVLIGALQTSVPSIAELFNGYIADLRIVKGTAVYTAAFTPPTAPLTAITNTSLLLNFANAGIYDSASGNDLETVGNAQVSTVQAKWGTTSLAFDGTGDWLTAIDRPTLRLGTAPFTIEGWIYYTGTSTRSLLGKGTSTTGWDVSIDTAGDLIFSYAASSISGGIIAVPSATWTHFAIVRTGTGTNQTNIYIAGVLTNQGTVATDFNQTNPLYVGASRTATQPLTGYIDDLRITNGYARYTANFTPPTAAFPLN